MPTTTVSPLDYPALYGRTVTEAHTRYCTEHGHATYKVDGTDTGTCPRCGEVKSTILVDPRELGEGDTIDAGGTRRAFRVQSVHEWGTGTVSVSGWSKGRFSEVWFKEGRKALLVRK